MKKIIFVIIGLVGVLVLNAQTLTVPTSYITSTDAVRDSFINWTIRSELLSLDTDNGTSTYTITDSWNPTNSDLNAIENAGGNTSEWPLYLVVNDSSFFSETILGTLGGNDYNIEGKNSQPLKTWGTYFKDTHEMWYYSAPNPDQFQILAAKEDGTIMTLDKVRQIVSDYSQCTGYRTVVTIESLKPSMEDRNDW